MSTEPFIGEIKILAFDWAPKNYLLCAGQLLPVNSNAALFSLLGTTYGGNGSTTFALPDLRGRMPLGQNSAGGQPIGQQAGTPNVTLLTENMPAHVHSAVGINVNIPVAGNGGDTDLPNGAYLAQSQGDFYSSAPTPGSNYGASTVSGQTALAGSGTSFSVMNPYLAVNYSIAIFGIFPSRN